MARPRPARITASQPGTSPRPRPRPRPAGRGAPRGVALAAIADWRGDPVVVRLTAKVHDLVKAAGRRSSDAVVAIGTHLEQIRDRLERERERERTRGHWRSWVEDNASFGRSTAANYIDLAAWARRERTQFERMKHLGPGKLYVLMRARPERVRGLKAGKAVLVPGSERRKSIETMTTVELASVVGDLQAPEVEVVAAIEIVVRTMRSKVAAMGAAAEVFVERADEVEMEVVRGVRDEVAAVLRRLEGVLDA